MAPIPNAQTIAAQISHQQGNHFLKSGFEWRLSQVISALTNENPGFGFDAAPTSSTYSTPYAGPANISGDGYATFLLGAIAPVNTGNQNCWACGFTSMPSTIVPNTEDRYYAGFVNDDWHVSRKLTLNPGLRYEHTSPCYEAHNRLTGPLNLSIPNTVVQNVQMPAAVRQYYGGSWILNGAYNLESSAAPSWNDKFGSLSPRAGFAYYVN
ncbi:MAG TPA: hypothetical protein VG345_00140 [Bryobacteraceae bacterium]|nr:hypothetical protein [Bryobacteraceae bacterium]